MSVPVLIDKPSPANAIAADPSSAIASAAGVFAPISLAELGTAELMDRVDRKYLVPSALLPNVLFGLRNEYRVLEVRGTRLSRYSTRYYDTEDLAMYHAHHSGKARRHKIRVRSYVDSDARFLEVKLKTNKGRTVKRRVPLVSELLDPMQRLAEEQLIGANDGIAPDRLHETMLIEYRRLTLVRNDSAERITLDLMLTFSSETETRAFPGVVIAEVKQAGQVASPFVDAMRANGIREGSLSKYCAGIATLNPELKSNRFRPALRRLASLGELKAESA